MFSTKKNKCFEKIFPKITLSFDKGSKTNFSDWTSLPASYENNPEICTVMKLSTDSSNSNRFLFESETVAHNNGIGIVVLLNSSNVKFKQQESSNGLLIECRVFLIWKNGSLWKVQEGFLFFYNDKSSVTIRSPDGSISKTFNKLTENNGSVNKWNTQYYSGIWKVKNGGTKNIFEGFEFKAGADDIFAKLKEETMSTPTSYVYKNSKWHETSSKNDSIYYFLISWLGEHKKGEWNTFKEDDCKIKDKSKYEEMDSDTKMFCFSESMN